MVSRKEVAESAGVSVAAVSYVLNNKQGVSEATRQRVWSAIEELGYKPSHAARSLKMKKTNCLSVFVNYLGDPFEAGVLNYLEQKLKIQGYFVQFQTYQTETEEEFRRFFAGRIDGLFILGQSLNSRTLQALESENIPVISIMEPVNVDGITAYVDIDWEEGMLELITHLAGQGHRRIGFMANGHKDHPHERRTQAFQVAMERAGLPLGKDSILYGGGRLEQAQKEMRRNLSAGLPGGHSAFIAASDLMAIGMLTACREARVQVPEQLCITGCENILMTLQITPAVTVLDVSRREIAEMAVELMVQSLEGKRASSRRLEAKLRARGSSCLSVKPH